MYTIEVNYPDFPKGTEFDIGGVAVKNGVATKISATDEQRIASFHGAPLKEALKGDHIKITGTKEGGDD